MIMLRRTGWLHAGRHLYENWARLWQSGGSFTRRRRSAGTLSRRNLFRERARHTATIIYLYSIRSGRMDGRRALKKGLHAYVIGYNVELSTVPTWIG